MLKYDPDHAPDPDEWNAMDDGEREYLIEKYHRSAKIRLPNARLHAVIHTLVENQIALGDEIPVKETVGRLMSEGLDRHDALRAVGYVLGNHMFDILKHKRPRPQSLYFEELRELTAEQWRSLADEDDDAP